MIHPSAIVSSKAKLADSVSVGPYSIISDQVSIGVNTKIGAHCVIEGNTTIGKNCEIFTGAVVGSRPQDLKFKNEKVFLEIGNNNIINSGVTIEHGTTIGSGNFFSANCCVGAMVKIKTSCFIGLNSTIREYSRKGMDYFRKI